MEFNSGFKGLKGNAIILSSMRCLQASQCSL